MSPSLSGVWSSGHAIPPRTGNWGLGMTPGEREGEKKQTVIHTEARYLELNNITII